MNYFFMTIRSIKKHAFNFALILVELAALFLIVNFTVSTIFDRQMLDAPFAKKLNENSVFVYDADYFDEYTRDPYGALQSRQNLLKEIDGEYECYDVLTYYGEGITIIAVSDEIYSRLRLPLASGNRRGAVGTFGTATGKRTVDIKGTPLELNVSGMLTSTTFLPAMSSYSSADFTTKDLFTSTVPNGDVIITNRSLIAAVEDKFIVSLGFLISFKSNAESNISRLEGLTFTVRGTDIRENSAAALRRDLTGFFPLFVCLFVIVVIGVVSISAIIYTHNEYQSGIMWICGYSRRQILFSHIVNVFVFLTAAIGVGAASYGMLRLLGNETAKTVMLNSGNLFATLALYAALGLIAMIIPVFKSAKKSPIEYLRRSK